MVTQTVLAFPRKDPASANHAACHSWIPDRTVARSGATHPDRHRTASPAIVGGRFTEYPILRALLNRLMRKQDSKSAEPAHALAMNRTHAIGRSRNARRGIFVDRHQGPRVVNSALGGCTGRRALRGRSGAATCFGRAGREQSPMRLPTGTEQSGTKRTLALVEQSHSSALTPNLPSPPHVADLILAARFTTTIP